MRAHLVPRNIIFVPMTICGAGIYTASENRIWFGTDCTNEGLG